MDTQSCPIALALVEQGYQTAVISGITAVVSDGSERYFANLPTEAITFVRDFDAIGRNAVHPLSFDLMFKSLPREEI